MTSWRVGHTSAVQVCHVLSQHRLWAGVMQYEMLPNAPGSVVCLQLVHPLASLKLVCEQEPMQDWKDSSA